MLLHVNFLATRWAERRRRLRLARAGRWTVPGLCFACLLPALLLSAVVARQTGRWQAVRAERETLAAAAAEARIRAEALKRLAEPRALTLQSHANNALWLALLKDVRDRLPDGVWLTELRLAAPTAEEPRQLLRLGGGAESQAAVGRYLEALNASAWFQVAVLTASEPATGAEPPLRWRITAPLRRAIPERAEPVPPTAGEATAEPAPAEPGEPSEASEPTAPEATEPPAEPPVGRPSPTRPAEPATTDEAPPGGEDETGPFIPENDYFRGRRNR